MLENDRQIPIPETKRINPRYILLHVRTIRRHLQDLPEPAQLKLGEVTDKIISSDPINAKNYELFMSMDDPRFDALCRKALMIKPVRRI